MSNDFAAKLRVRRERVEAEMQGRLDELDRAIELAMSEARPSSRSAERKGGRRPQATTLDDIFEPAILRELRTRTAVSTAVIERLFPDTPVGPMVSAWKRRAESSGFDFDELVKRTKVPGERRFAYSLTAKGRELLGAGETSPSSES